MGLRDFLKKAAENGEREREEEEDTINLDNAFQAIKQLKKSKE